MRVGIVDDDISALGPDAADFSRRFDPLAEFVIAGRAEHNHAITKAELSVCDAPVVTRYDEVVLETEGVAQPFDSSGRIAVPHSRNDGRRGDLGIA